MRESPFYQDILEEGRQEGFEEVFQEAFQEVFQEAFQEGFEEGRQEGFQEGIRWLLSKIVPMLQSEGFPVESILALGDLTLADLDLEDQ